MNKQQRYTKKAQQRSLKRKQTKKSRRSTKGRQIPSSFNEEERDFWIAHGVNYMLSPSSEGIWTPLFPEIYEGKQVSREQAAQRVIVHFQGKENSSLRDYMLAWCFHDRGTIWTYKQTSEMLIQEKEPGVDSHVRSREPHCVPVWELFENLVSAIRSSLNK